jgi:integrase
MSRPATGQVVERRRERGVAYGLRFRAYGKRRYVHLGYRDVGMTQAKAEEALADVLADVRRGIWQPPEAAPVVEEPKPEPTFHEFASTWLAGREAEGLAAKTIADLRWSLTNHLLPFFADHLLSEITIQEIDRYKVAKVEEPTKLEAAREAARERGERLGVRGLSNGSINHTLKHLAQVLESAVEYELLASNPAAGKRRRLKAAKPARPWVEPEQLMALLDAAKADDGRAGVGRVLLGLLAGAGLRIGEALALRWQNVDTGTGSLHVVHAKTAAGVREVDLTAALREELAVWRADAQPVEPPPRRARPGGRTGERDARQGGDRGDRPDHVPLAPPLLREPSLRVRRRRPLHGRPARPRRPALHAPRLCAGDEAA